MDIEITRSNNNSDSSLLDFFIYKPTDIEAYSCLRICDQSFSLYSKPKIPIALYFFKGLECMENFMIEYQYMEDKSSTFKKIIKSRYKGNEETYKAYTYNYSSEMHYKMKREVETEEEKQERRRFMKLCKSSWKNN